MRKFKNSIVIDGDTVSKKKDDNVIELYEYLKERNFDNIPEIIEINDREIKSKYIESEKYFETIDGLEIIKTMASLHSKTMFYKDISINKHKEIYDNIMNNIEYLKDYYDNIIDDIETEVYMSPSHYLFARNYSVIVGSLKYSESELKKWYALVKNKTSERVSIVHNNISKDHFIRGDKNYLISWEKHLVDTPVLDIYKFYKKDGYKLNFELLYEEYNKIFSLSEEESKLFKILISIPPKMTFLDNEYDNTIYVKDVFKYIYESSKLINVETNKV